MCLCVSVFVCACVFACVSVLVRVCVSVWGRVSLYLSRALIRFTPLTLILKRSGSWSASAMYRPKAGMHAAIRNSETTKENAAGCAITYATTRSVSMSHTIRLSLPSFSFSRSWSGGSDRFIPSLPPPPSSLFAIVFWFLLGSPVAPVRSASL